MSALLLGFWAEMALAILLRVTFRRLRGSCLKGVMFVIPDNHGVLTQAIVKHFQGASWQCCQVHSMMNILSHSPVKGRAEVAVGANLVLHALDMMEAQRR